MNAVSVVSTNGDGAVVVCKASRLTIVYTAQQLAPPHINNSPCPTRCTISERSPFASPDGRSLALAKQAKAIYAELDGRPLIFIPGSGAGTDAGYAGRSGKPAVLESLGLAGWGYHAKNEYVELDSIVPRLYLTARMLVESSR